MVGYVGLFFFLSGICATLYFVLRGTCIFLLLQNMLSFQMISLFCKIMVNFNLDLQNAYSPVSVWCHLQICYVQCVSLDLGCKYQDWTEAMWTHPVWHTLLLGCYSVLEFNLDCASMACGCATGYPNLRICHNGTLQKALLKSTSIILAVFPVFISLPALIQKKLNWFEMAFSLILAGCCSFGVCVGPVCGCAITAYTFLAFSWHNHSPSLKSVSSFSWLCRGPENYLSL